VFVFLCVLGFVDWCGVWTRALLGLNTYSLDVFHLVVINMVNILVSDSPSLLCGQNLCSLLSELMSKLDPNELSIEGESEGAQARTGCTLSLKGSIQSIT
jgi:hypothetical protein